MIRLAVLVSAVLCVTAIPGMQIGDKPSYCHGLDCPKFDSYHVNDKADGVTIEIRTYQAAFWSAANITSMSLTDAESKGFHKNFDYISGAHEGSEKVEMTTPVLTRVIPGQ